MLLVISKINIGDIINFCGLCLVVIAFIYDKKRNRKKDDENIATKDWVNDKINIIEKHHNDSIEEIKTIFEKTEENIIAQFKLTTEPIQKGLGEVKGMIGEQDKRLFEHIKESHD